MGSMYEVSYSWSVHLSRRCQSVEKAGTGVKSRGSPKDRPAGKSVGGRGVQGAGVLGCSMGLVQVSRV